ncbi:hypothetical protein [Bacillus pumilus]|uniref:hypothetical protein n=1 Tax=Bacillus pumilus TaxID=1408 RepID=UPI0031F5880A
MSVIGTEQVQVYVEGVWTQQPFSELSCGQVFKMLHEEGIGIYEQLAMHGTTSCMSSGLYILKKITVD